MPRLERARVGLVRRQWPATSRASWLRLVSSFAGMSHVRWLESLRLLISARRANRSAASRSASSGEVGVPAVPAVDVGCRFAARARASSADTSAMLG